eukprot:3310354-Pyramimonas_sp.AAC.1
MDSMHLSSEGASTTNRPRSRSRAARLSKRAWTVVALARWAPWTWPTSTTAYWAGTARATAWPGGACRKQMR